MSQILDAAFAVVHGYPGGALSLAPRLPRAKNPATVSHEVAGKPGSKFGLEDAVDVTLLTGDTRIVSTFAAMAGGMFIPLPAELPDGTSAMQQIGRMAKEFGDVVQAVVEAIADGRVSANELTRVNREWGELVAVMQSVIAHMEAVHASGAKPQR